MMKAICLWIVLCLLSGIPISVGAADIAGDVQQSGGFSSNGDGGYFELGFGIGHFHNPFQIRQEDYDGAIADIDGSFVFRKKGFFGEVVQGTQDGLNLGYNAWQNDRWSIDILVGSMNGVYEPDLETEVKPGDDEDTRNEKLYNRHTLFLGTGIRVSHYIGNYVMQYRLVADTLDGNGLISTLRLGRGWQYRNWNYHCILSAQYTSETTNNYWYGVENYEATARYPAYHPEASLSYSAQFGITKPLSEKWVARLFTGWTQYPNEARDSPFVDDSDFSFVALTVNRVFSWGP